MITEGDCGDDVIYCLKRLENFSLLHLMH